MINLFSLIADQVRNTQDLFDEEGKIMQALLNSGYHINEANAALMLMQTIAQNHAEDGATRKKTAPAPMRAMNREERERISAEAFSFVSKLARLGIISEDQREELLDKAMTVYAEHIELDHIKSLIAFTLFAHPHDQGHDGFPGIRRIKRTAWN
jgi:uncharacterized protein Smg (DUF494 family)